MAEPMGGSEGTCAICSRGGAYVETLKNQDVDEVSCQICGRYQTDRLVAAELQRRELGQTDRLKLTWAARQASERDSSLQLRGDSLKDVIATVFEPQPLSRKLDELILFVGTRAESFDKAVPFNLTHDWPLVYARNENESASLLRELIDEGDLRADGRGLRLTTAGWKRFTRLEAVRPKSTNAFVAMRFNDEMEKVYDAAFYPTLFDLGYDPIKVNREQHLGKIDDFIVANIRKSALLVADFTGMRSGVFFEAGFGLGLGIPVVWTCRADETDELGKHFDTRQYNHIVWRDADDLKRRLRERIEATILARPKPRSLA